MNAAHDEVSTAGQRLEGFLRALLNALAVDGKVEVVEDGDQLTGRVTGEELGVLIGRRGQTIDAIQHLAPKFVNNGAEGRYRVLIDVDDYRERRSEALCAEADAAAEEVEQSGEAVEIGPLPALERRIVHEHLRDRGGVRTESEGEEPERYVVVSPF